MPRQNCTKTKKELEEAIKGTIIRYKEIIFGSDIPTCMACLDELWKQQIIDKKKCIIKGWCRIQWENWHGKGFKEILWWMMKRWSIRGQMRFWILQLIPHTGKTSFRPIFMVFIDHKIISHRVEELHILNGIDTLDTWSICDFSKKISSPFFLPCLSLFFLAVLSWSFLAWPWLGYQYQP